MKAVYSEYLTIDTKPDTILDISSPVWALQEVVRGKALVFGNGIVPLALQELVGQHPKPFDRAAPAGRSTSAVSILLASTKCFQAAHIFVTPRKHTILPSSAKWSITQRRKEHKHDSPD